MEKMENFINKKNLFALAEETEYYYIVNSLTDNEDIPTGLIKLPLSNGALLKLVKLFQNKEVQNFEKLVLILKPIELDINEEIPNYSILTIDSKQLQYGSENTDIMEYKLKIILNLSQLFDSKLTTVSNLTYYEFTVLNNKLADNGYFITNENREEKYIEILETENEELIDDLEKYLICKDEIERVYAAYNNYRKFKQELHECETMEELNEKYLNFLDSWQSKAGYSKIENK
jgi:hypothetical protein